MTNNMINKEYIRQGKFELVKLSCSCSCSNLCSERFLLLKDLINIPDIITEEVQQTIERIYNPYRNDSNDWVKILIKIHPSFNKLKYFLEKNLISPNDFKTTCDEKCDQDEDINRNEYTIMHHYLWRSVQIYFVWKDRFDFLLSDEIGGNINIQDDNGNTLLHCILKCRYEKDTHERYPKIYDSYLQKINYLLEHGADPLLENKKGVNAIDYVKKRPSNPNSFKDDILCLLESYA